MTDPQGQAATVAAWKHGGPRPCEGERFGYTSCPNMRETGGDMSGERYRCAVCGHSYWLDYEEMR